MKIISSLVLGIFIGVLLTIIFIKIFKEKDFKEIKLIKEFIKSIIYRFIKYPIEWILGLIITFVVICQFIKPNPIEKSSFDLLNFISSVALAWIMTKYSVKNDFEDRQKEVCVISYGYSNNIHRKLKRSIRVCDLTQKKLELCNCNSGSCDLKDNLHRIRDLMICIDEDINQNTTNWANNISEEIEILNKIKLEQQKIIKKEEQIQQLSIENIEERKEIESLKNEIKEVNEIISKLNKDINSKIRHMLNNNNASSDNYLVEIDKEIKDQEAKIENRSRGIIEKSKGLKSRSSAV